MTGNGRKIGVRPRVRAHAVRLRARARAHAGVPGVRAGVLAGVLLVGGLLAGCGGGSSAPATATVAVVPSSPATSTRAAAGGGVVASVAGVPVSKAGYGHWLVVEEKLGGSADAGHRALGFLLSSQWVLGEAAARHIVVSEAEVKRRFEELRRKSFPKAGSLEKYYSTSGEIEADLLVRVRVELLSSRIAAQVGVGKSAAQRSAVLAGFQGSFHAHWKALTSCQPGYLMEDCRQYHGKAENLAPTNSGAASAGGSSHASSAHAAVSASSSSSSSSGEAYTSPGGFSLSSSAFERNGAIPARYTCAGAGISPPLSWTHVPAHAAELVLFVIDDSADGSSGGIRWVVAGIDPGSTGVAAGETPPGGILGTNTAGKAAYSAICPAPGKTDTVEFVMYALKQTISLTPGFQPATAEARYGKLLLGQAAVTYATASR